MKSLVNKLFGIICATLILGSAPGYAFVPLSDSADGMTCTHYAVGFKLAWQRKGGDWVDATGTAYGDKAYAEARVPIMADRQLVMIDVTALAQQWVAGEALPGAMLLRALPGTRSGTVDFASKEHPDSAAHPSLVVEWSDGSRDRLRPSADTYLPCSTVASVGNQPNFQAGGGGRAVIVFPFAPRADGSVKSAELVLTSDKQYGSTSVIGVFQPMLASPQSAPTTVGLAEPFPLDRSIENDPDVLFVERFEASNWVKSWSDYDKTGDAEAVATQAGERFESLDGKALQVTIRKGSTQGLNMHYRFAGRGDGEPEEVFFRYYLRFGESWDPVVDGGKMPGLSGTYGRAGWGGRRSDGRNGWAARGSFYRNSDTDTDSPLAQLRGIGWYVAHVDMADRYGDIWGWDLGPTGLLEKNRWYSIEQQVRMNSPGERDGVLRAWVDGQLVFEKTDMRYRDVPDLRIESVWMNVYHGGTRPAHKDLTLFIDNVVIARKYIGPFTGRP